MMKKEIMYVHKLLENYVPKDFEVGAYSKVVVGYLHIRLDPLFVKHHTSLSSAPCTSSLSHLT